MKNVPEWLQQARGRDGAIRSEHATEDLTDVCPGDLWIVESGDASAERRVVLVLNAKGCVVDVALTSEFVDMAADRDLRLSRTDTGAPYDLMVETACTGRIHWGRVVRRVGIIDDSLVDDILDFIWGERPASLESRQGPAFTHPVNGARLSFERAEADALRRLQTDPEMAHAVDRSHIESLCRVNEYLETFDALLDPSTVVCVGADRELFSQPGAADIAASIVGPDVQLRLEELFTHRLLDGHIVGLHRVDSSEHAILETINTTKDNHARYLVLTGTGPCDGPIGTVDGRLVFSGGSSDGPEGGFGE